MKIERGEGILKVMIVAFLLVVIVNALEFWFIKKEYLREIRGKIIDITVKKYDCPGYGYFKAGCEKTTIHLENVNEEFGVADYSGRGAFIDEIEKGDEVTIYVRKWYQYFLTFGGVNDIYGLEKGGSVLYDMRKWKASNIGFMKTFGILFLVFGGLFILQRRAVTKLIKGNRL